MSGINTVFQVRVYLSRDFRLYFSTTFMTMFDVSPLSLSVTVSVAVPA